MTSLQAMVDRTTELVALPEVYLRLRDKLAEPDYRLDDLAAIVGQDPAITANLLRLANSAFFGFAARIPTVSRAITVLGPRQLHDLLLATSVCASFDNAAGAGMDRHRFWRRSLLCACLSRLLARRCAVLDREAAYVHGLLHGIGQMVMWMRMPAETAAAHEQAQARGVAVDAVQREMLGFDYAAVGALLLQRWHMPAELVEVVRHHVEPSAAGLCVVDAAVVHISARVAEVLVEGAETPPPELVADTVWGLAGADPGCLAGICAQALPQANDAMNVLFGAASLSA